MKARLLLNVTVTSLLSLAGNRSMAGPWSAQPLLGLATEYASNPQLLHSGGDESARAALFVDLPVAFDSDAIHFSLLPRVRYGGGSGYSTLTSNYYHVDSAFQYLDDRDSLTVSGAAYQDSSLLYAAEFSNGRGVRRTTVNGNLDYARAITERLQLKLDGGSSRTTYAGLAGSNLTDYRYSQGAATASYAVTERDSLQMLGNISHYASLNGASDSDAFDLQLGGTRKLTELWTLSGSAGYSRSKNNYRFYFGNFYLGSTKSDQTGAVYSVSLSRLTETTNTTFGATRALTPTGSAFLTRQESLNFSETYRRSERWDLTSTLVWSTVDDPTVTGGIADRHRYYVGSLQTNWHATEKWTVSLRLERVGQHFSQNIEDAATNNVSLEFSCQFYRSNQ